MFRRIGYMIGTAIRLALEMVGAYLSIIVIEVIIGFACYSFFNWDIPMDTVFKVTAIIVGIIYALSLIGIYKNDLWVSVNRDMDEANDKFAEQQERENRQMLNSTLKDHTRRTGRYF